MEANLTDMTLRLQCTDPKCVCQKNRKNGKSMVHCPSHNDIRPTLSLTEREGKILWKCFARCTQAEVTTALRERGIIGSSNNKSRNITNGRVGHKVTNSQSSTAGVSTEALAKVKNLPLELLQEWGVCDRRRDQVTQVAIPYLDEGGNTLATRYRLSLAADGQRFSWRKGDRTCLYGLNKLKDIQERGWVNLSEGESDTWTGWHHNVPVLGIPGKATWRSDWAGCLDGLDVYLWVEPEAEDIIARVGADLPGLRVIYAPDGVKDISEAHLQGLDVAAKVEELKANAIPVQDILRLQANQRAAELQARATSVLASPDPVEVVKDAIRASGYGGDLRNALVVYLAATSRLLAMRQGAMPVHLLLLGPASAGKSYTVQAILDLLPEEAKHVIDAGSPRTLIYDDAPLEHRVLVFGEADSLPAGEDNPAASAVRNLTQDNHLHYSVTVRDPETGGFTVRTIEKPGPTVLVTTSVKPLGSQLMTRLFTIDVSGDAEQVKAALAMQAALEIEGAKPVDGTLVDFQAYLQALAPWEVFVPFAPNLAESIGQSTAATRVLRDFQRILSLIKAVAVLRHQHRARDDHGRLVATLADYRTVYELVADIYESSVTGVSEGVTNLVTKVGELREADKDLRITFSVLERELKVDRSLIRRRTNMAVRNGWIINRETRKGYQADLIPGEPIPEKRGLPDPDRVCDPVTALTDGNINTIVSSEVERWVI
jgi:hypothetical protein